MKNLIESLKEESENSRTAESPKISLQMRGKRLEALVDSGRVFKYLGTTQLVRPLYHLFIFNVGPTPAELSARPLQRVDFYREILEQIF